MSHLPRFLIACLAVVLILPTVAYADDSEEAHRLIDQINDLTEQGNELDAKATALFMKVGEIGEGPSKDYAEALPLLDEVGVAADEILAKIESVAALVDEAATLDLSPEFKEYLGLFREVVRLNSEYYALNDDIITGLRTIYGEWNSLSPSERDDLTAELVALGDQAREIKAESEAGLAAADKYYADNQLDEESSDSGIGIPTIVWLAAVAFGSFFVGRWYRRRKLRSAIQGPEGGPGPEETASDQQAGEPVERVESGNKGGPS